MSILLAADLHLDTTHPVRLQKFCEGIKRYAYQAQALYLLGDIFSAWIGMDYAPALNQTVIQALHSLTSQKIPVYILVGNRDFLLNRHFFKKSGSQLLKDPSLIHVDGIPLLISHGDIFCIDDVNYQKFRKKAHHPLRQIIFRALPLSRRETILKKIQSVNQIEKKEKTEYQMDVNLDAVKKAMQKNHTQYLIHGHTHRDGVYPLSVDQKSCKRIVLKSWEDDKAHFLSCSATPNSDTLSLEFIDF